MNFEVKNIVELLKEYFMMIIKEKIEIFHWVQSHLKNENDFCNKN